MIIANAYGANFVDRPAWSQGFCPQIDNLEASGLKHLLARRLHVLDHVAIVVTKFDVKTQNRNAPLVLYHGIQIDIIFVARQHLTERAHINVGASVVADFLFKRRAEAF